MDLLQLAFLFLSLSFLLFLLILTRRGYNPKPHSLDLPPGPWKLPIIGNIHHLLTAFPHHAFRRLARVHGPLMLVRLGQVDVVVVSSPEAASEVMKAQDANFSSRPEILVSKVLGYGCKDIAFAPYGAYWRQLKKISVVELLSAKRVNSFHSLFEEEISELVREISASNEKPINLTTKLVALTGTIIARCAFGSKSEHQQRFILAVKAALKLASGFNVVDLFPNVKFIDILSGIRFKVERIHRNLDEILVDIIKEHEVKGAKNEPGTLEQDEEDLVDVLLRIKEHGELEFPLTFDNIKAVILDMFIAGTETSSTTIVWAMSELMKNPRLMEKGQAEVRRVLKERTKIEDSDLGELHYLKLVIKETLRLHPPGPLLVPRQSIETCQVHGYNIPAGTRVAVNAWALGRDPRYWDDAESFNPERFNGSPVDFKGANFEFVPFGAGRRICPGITFGITTVELALAHLLLNFNWELPNGKKPQELDMSESFGLAAARKSDLFLLATPYTPSAE